MVGEQTIPVGTDVTLPLEGFGEIPSETRHNGPERLGIKFKDDEAVEKKLSEWLAAE